MPGLSSASVAALDPIYSANYASIYGPSQAGLRVFFNAAPGLAAGWYTLLPAQYALLPGGMRVVQDTGAVTPPPVGGTTLTDGTIVTSGFFGVAGVNTRSATLSVFDVQTQPLIRQESNIALTSGSETFAADAALAGDPTPRLPIDAGRLILTPLNSLAIDATFQTTPANLSAIGSSPALVGRGSEVDISGSSLIIDSASNPAAPTPGAIVLSDTSLANLNAASLFLGGTRTDNTDGTTSLDITSNSITVDSGVTLSAPEILLATDGKKSLLSIADGASIIASGTVTDPAMGDYVIDGLAVDGVTRIQTGDGALLRVSNGPERLVSRLDIQASAPASTLSVGADTLQGAAIELESAALLTINSAAVIKTPALALGAGKFTFGASGNGLVVTPSLQTLFSQVGSLSLQSSRTITFMAGNYDFGDLHLDTPGLADNGGGAVSISASDLTLSNRSAALTACGTGAQPVCGGGTLTISAGQVAFGGGTQFIYGAGAGVNINAANGVFIDGVAALDVGPAPLTINSPFVGDRGTGKAGATAPSLSLTTTGSVTIASATPASAFAAPTGTPGSSLTIGGLPGEAAPSSVTIQGAELRATAGTLDITSSSGIAISGGALLTTPGYVKVFGDSADPTTVSAPGGSLTLTALAGDISVSDDSSLSVGGGQGVAGSLALSAQNGQVFAYHGAVSNLVSLASVLSAAAPGGGGSLSLDTGGAFDLSAFAAGSGAQFTGAIAVRSGTGDLTLGAGDSLTATSVQLTADGGSIADFGLINTSGVNGGDVSLYGATGVHLASGAVIDAHANGYGETSTLQAAGGNVTLGVDGTGAITVDAGATIDVAPLQTLNDIAAQIAAGVIPGSATGNRLVNMNRTDGTFYTYVAADTGGTVTFRAPVIFGVGGETVNVAVQGSVSGASSVVLEGFQRFDLNALANNPNYVGVTVANNTATLNLATTGAAGQVNALSDPNGPVVQFVQNFNLSADYGALNGLASQANFHAQPGIELDYTGNIVLASNWNLGAGVVNMPAAIKAGLLTPDPDLPGQYVVTPGAEGLLLAQYTDAIYRVGGTFFGEPGILTIRAGGNLDLQNSITDGFFQFGDQTDPNYLNQLLGGGNRAFQAALTPFCAAGSCSGVPNWSAGATVPGDFVSISFPSTGAGLSLAPYVLPSAPYSAAANSAAAVGDSPVAGGALIAGTGDPLGSAQLFPLLPTSSGGVTPVMSWSYQLVGGADLTGAGGKPSVNPLTVVTATSATAAPSVIVEGQHVYGYEPVKGTTSFSPGLDLEDSNTNDFLSATDWLASFTQATENPGLTPDAYTIINYAAAPASVRTEIAGLVSQYFLMHPSDLASAQVGKRSTVSATLTVATNLLGFISSSFPFSAAGYRPPAEVGPGFPPVYATAPSLVRTGTGNIQVAASGTINLLNGLGGFGGAETPTLLDSQGAIVASNSAKISLAERGVLQLGGSSIYTAGHLADLDMTTATDVQTGITYNVDLGANAVFSDNLNNQSNPYTYGVAPKGQTATSIAGILVANPVYADGGGNVTLNAGVDVLGRRDTFLENELGGVGTEGAANALPLWVGSGDLPWRTGSIGDLVNLLIDPQLFAEGVGTLGGGDISINAGRNVSDISITAAGAATTANVGGLDAAGSQPQALVNLAGGNVSVIAGGDILGGRLEIAAGDATLKAAGDVSAAGDITLPNGGPITPGGATLSVSTVANTLRVQLSDGDVSIIAGGSATLQGIAALGVGGDNASSAGFYAAGSGVSILSDGAVSIANTGNDLLSPAIGADPVSAVYPGSFQSISFTGGIDLAAAPNGTPSAQVLLYPDPTGTLTLLAGGDIAPAVIAQLDSDPTLLPGAFSSFTTLPGDALVVGSGLAFGFPTVLPNTSDVVLRELHNPNITHADDSAPNRIVAGNDIDDVILSLAKQTRVSAGRDIVNLVFLGQNINPGDVTRIVAGRDITATTSLVSPFVRNAGGAAVPSASELPALQGDTFVLGGPGAFFLEAGRNAGPFLNSAVTDGFATNPDGTRQPTGSLTYGGGILTVGNLWDPWLGAQGADIYTEFGVSKGQNYAGLISTYLTPANFSSLPGYLFEQTTDANGNPAPDRTQEVYALSLVDWMKSIASAVIARYDTAQGVSTPPANAPALIQFLQGLQKGGSATTAQALMFLPQLSDQTLPLIPWLQLNESAALIKAFGTDDVTYTQAFTAFQNLPSLTQREFLLKDVYFNELVQTSIPTSPSFLVYSRGYQAVNTLFPGSDGYTQNSLNGGPAGASSTVTTGNLDLRLSTIQTEEGGNIIILGPGGRVLAGSTVSTSVQASRRVYEGGSLYSGVLASSPFIQSGAPGDAIAPLPSTITQIPPGFEGVLTLRGGSIDSFTDGDFLLNQSRAFTEEGGDIALWSSNADVNAGQGPRTTADVPPVVVRIDANGFSQVSTTSAVSGAGIGAFNADSSGLAPDVFLIAPRGTVDAGAAGVRSSGNVYVAAFQVANADAIQAQGTISGAGAAAPPNVNAATSSNAASAAASQAAQAAAGSQGGDNQRPLIFVDVLGFLGDEADGPSDDAARKRR